MNAIDRKPAPQAKPQSQRKHKQPTESLRGPPSVTVYTPPTLHRADDGMSEGVFGTNPDDLGQFRRSDDNVGFHSLLRSDDESDDNEVDNDDDDDDMEDEDYVPSVSSRSCRRLSERCLLGI